jgi:hypothetical protein
VTRADRAAASASNRIGSPSTAQMIEYQSDGVASNMASACSLTHAPSRLVLSDVVVDREVVRVAFQRHAIGFDLVSPPAAGRFVVEFRRFH